MVFVEDAIFAMVFEVLVNYSKCNFVHWHAVLSNQNIIGLLSFSPLDSPANLPII